MEVWGATTVEAAQGPVSERLSAPPALAAVEVWTTVWVIVAGGRRHHGGAASDRQRAFSQPTAPAHLTKRAFQLSQRHSRIPPPLLAFARRVRTSSGSAHRRCLRSPEAGGRPHRH